MNSKIIVKSYKDLIVWQKAMDLVVFIYKITELYPKSEVYGLTSQTRRSAVSIASNIAEGKNRSSRKDFRNFLYNAYGSAAELETQIEIAKRLKYERIEKFSDIDSLLLEVLKMLNILIKKLKPEN